MLPATPPADPLLRAPATELVDLLRRREVGAVELLDAVLRRADEITPTVNPYAVRLDAQARAAARAADRRLAAGEALPLDGLPLTAKDSQWLAGVATTSGSHARAAFVPGATVGGLQRLLDAGAVVYAKTTTSEFCYSAASYAPAFGVTRNPHDLARSAGGSSGGAAAHVAAWAGPVALGGDGGGSIRIPGAFCGVVGHKPTFGLVPHEPSDPGWKTLIAIGPLARTADDAALLLRVLAGAHPHDRHSLSLAASTDPPVPPRVAVSEDLGFAAVDDDVRTAFRRAVAALAGAGVEVVEAHPVRESAVRTWAGIATAEAHWAQNGTPQASPDVAAYLAFGASIGVEAYVRAQFERDRIHAVYAEFFAATGAGALLTPTLGCTAFAADRSYPDAVGGVAVDDVWRDFAPLLYDANLAGLPACTVPIGRGVDGLPIGAQLLGPRLSDLRILRLAATVQAAPPT